MINQLRNHSTKEHTEQWTAPKDHKYPRDYGEKLLNRMGGVMTTEVSFFEGERTGQWTIAKECTCPSDYCKKSLTRLEGVITREVPFLEGERTGQRTVPKGCMYPSDYGKKSLNCLEGVEGEGSYLHWTGIADNYEVQRENSKKAIYRCNVMERNLHSVNMEVYVKRKDQLDKRESSEKSIYQIQCNHSVEKKLKPTLAMLCADYSDISEKSIIPLSEAREKEELKIPNNSVTEQTDKRDNVDLQQGWGKAVSFITNTSNKLSLCSALRSLAQILGVTRTGKTKENCSTKQSNLDRTNSISDSSFTFFLLQGLSVPFACIGSGDPVRVLRLYTTNTLDTL